jgi:hypothetical protein
MIIAYKKTFVNISLEKLLRLCLFPSADNQVFQRDVVNNIVYCLSDFFPYFNCNTGIGIFTLSAPSSGSLQVQGFPP